MPCTACAGCDNSIFLSYLTGTPMVLPLVQFSAQCVLTVIKISFIKYRFLKSMFRLRGRKRSTIAYTNNRLQRFLVPSVQSCFMPRHLRHMIYQLNYGIEYLGLGKVMWYQQKVGTQIARVPRTHVIRG